MVQLSLLNFYYQLDSEIISGYTRYGLILDTMFKGRKT